MKVSADRIRSFLKEFKMIASGSGIHVVNRTVNINALAEMGLTSKNREDEILSLSVADYCGGPERDRDKPGEVWMFGKQVGEKEVYIKLKIAEVTSVPGAEGKIAKCISFHAAEHTLRFLQRGKTKQKGGRNI